MKISFNPNMPPLTMKKMDSDSDENEGPGTYLDNGRYQYQLKHIDTAIQIAKNRKMYSLIFEPAGNAEMFFLIKNKMVEFHRTYIGIKLGQVTKE